MEPLVLPDAHNDFGSMSPSSLLSIVARILVEQDSEDRLIAVLDPFGCDRFFAHEFSVHGARGDVSALRAAAATFAERVIRVERPARVVALAGLRDLGMIAAALTRHGVQLDTVPVLPTALAHAGRHAEEVPRDTVFSYTLRNPADGRLRTFTNRPVEKGFIASTRTGMSYNAASLGYLSLAFALGFHSPDFAPAMNGAREAFEKMVLAILAVKAQVSAEAFTFELRPFFEPYSVNGISYAAPGGAQMPLLLIDRMVWADEKADSWYTAYFTDNIRYLPRRYRNLAESLRRMTNFVERAIKIPEVDLSKDVVQSSLRSLEVFLATLLKFRYPHKRVAEDNFRLRATDARGSGGYAPDSLQHLIAGTAGALARIKYLERNP